MLRAALIWAAVGLVLAVPLGLSLSSPLLAWRDPVYVASGAAGVVALGLMLVQPLLARGLLPGLRGLHGRRVHRWVALALVGAVLLHVAGLWITSPPDVMDALLFASPTPFSAWGVVAMWALLLTGALAVIRKPLRLSPRRWRRVHGALAAVIVVGSVVHAWLVIGTMEVWSKAVLSAFVLAAAGFAFLAPQAPRR